MNRTNNQYLFRIFPPTDRHTAGGEDRLSNVGISLYKIRDENQNPSLGGMVHVTSERNIGLCLDEDDYAAFSRVMDKINSSIDARIDSEE